MHRLWRAQTEQRMEHGLALWSLSGAKRWAPFCADHSLVLRTFGAPEMAVNGPKHQNCPFFGQFHVSWCLNRCLHTALVLCCSCLSCSIGISGCINGRPMRLWTTSLCYARTATWDTEEPVHAAPMQKPAAPEAVRVAVGTAAGLQRSQQAVAKVRWAHLGKHKGITAQ